MIDYAKNDHLFNYYGQEWIPKSIVKSNYGNQKPVSLLMNVVIFIYYTFGVIPNLGKNKSTKPAV